MIGFQILEAKFWLNPVVRVAYNDGFDSRTLRQLAGVVESKRGSDRKGVE